LVSDLGFVDGAVVERFDCYEGTSAKAKLSKDLYVQGVNFLARKPEPPRAGRPDRSAP
jgi:hypothetical protein